MKNILSVIVVALVLVAVVTGCGGMHRYDARLAAADSLMLDVPDSALALVQAVDPASLTREGDRAYRDLLLTQARYRCYITATSDSDINRALNYYRRHDGEREKLTRAYIYKGAVMEELGHPDSAMLYYKHAEATAAPDDYFNLGYVNMRIGTLYDNYYAYDGMDINKFESALMFFKLANELRYQHTCLNVLGCLYRETKPQEAEQLLKKALSISQEFNDTTAILVDSHALVVLYYYTKDYKTALHLIHYMKQFGYPKDISMYTTIANVYSRLGMPDSAVIFLNYAQNEGIDDDVNRLYYLESLSEIALARGDSLNYLAYNRSYNQMSDSLVGNTEKLLISKTENDYDTIVHGNIKTHSHHMKYGVIVITIIAVLSFIMFFAFYWRRHKRYQQIFNELKRESDTQLKSLNKLQQTIDKLKINDQQTKWFVNNQMDMLRDITEACYHNPKNKLAVHVKSLLQFNDNNRQNWTGLYDYIDAEYNDIMSATLKNYPQLNDKDLLLIALTCLGFSYIQIAIIMGYSNHTSVSILKKRLAEKMKLENSINDYISSFT